MWEQAIWLILKEKKKEVFHSKMSYKQAITDSMKKLAQKPNTLFLGYNISYGSKAYTTLSEIPEGKKIETPLAENLMIGFAIGLSLEGYKPVVFFERHDFMLNALDGIVNHLDKIEKMSEQQFKTPVIIRAVIGSKSPLDPGLQHTQDFTEAFKILIKHFQIFTPKTPEEVTQAYNQAIESDKPIMIIEDKNLY